jgi:DNA-binding CsgD family transcriptional regulator
MHCRASCEQSRIAAALLNVMDVPIAILTSEGVPLASNAAFGQLHLARSATSRDRLVLCNAASDAQLAEYLTGPRPKRGSIPVPGGRGHCAMMLDLSPLPEALKAVWPEAGLVMVALLTSAKSVPAPEALMLMFGLTQAEARIARAIAEGKTTSSIARSVNTSRETVRSQLKSVLAKTGASRQGELISLLTATRLFRD